MEKRKEILAECDPARVKDTFVGCSFLAEGGWPCDLTFPRPDQLCLPCQKERKRREK